LFEIMIIPIKLVTKLIHHSYVCHPIQPLSPFHQLA